MASKRKSKVAAADSILAQPARDLEKAPKAQFPTGYGDLLNDLKTRIRAAQVKAALAVNRELIELYWHIGKAIVERQEAEGWGKSVVERLAADLQQEFPGLKSFSARNIWYARSFYLAYAGETSKLQQPAAELQESKLQQLVAETSETKLQQPVAELEQGAILPQAAGEIPWGHNITLIEKIKDCAERLWYAQQTVQNGWSRAMLVHWIESGLYSRQGKAVTNFEAVLPSPQSDLAQQIIKDPYNFDFLTLAADARERELENGLLDHIRRFLQELGAGFAFVGQQYHLEVDGEDFYIDLLFYHLRLRSYVVVDLKVESFKPEFAGKMNFYLSAVDDQLRHGDDKPSIGLILCKTRSKVIAEYALRRLAAPVGVAQYVTRLVEKLPANLKNSLPSPKDLEAELKSIRRVKRTGAEG